MKTANASTPPPRWPRNWGGLDRVTVWLRARKVGAGCKVGRVLVFTAAEVEAIRDAPDGRRREHRRR